MKDFLSYIRMIARPDDRLAFWRVINTPHRGIGIKSLEKIDGAANLAGSSPFHLVQSPPKDLGLGGTGARSLAEFVGLIQGFQQKSLQTPEDVRTLGEDVIKAFGLVADIRATTKDAGSRERKVENLRSLPNWLERCAQDFVSEKNSLDFHELLDKLTLGERDISEKNDKNAGNKVSLMTIHASKGLEFPIVFLCGLEEELFPHKNSLGSVQGVSEERRLFYVALTRAKIKLFLTWAQERGFGFNKSIRMPSRFLKEIPADILNGSLEGAPYVAPTKEEKMAKTISSFASLRAGLGGKV